MLDPRKFVDLNKNYDTAESFISWLFANHEELRNLGLVVAAIIGIPFLIWRSFSLNRSSKAADKQAENASKSHVADTYTKAIEQMGAVDNKGEPNLELRLGGLYALEKIAKANEDYHPQIMEVLCAYVRMHCPNENEEEKSNDSNSEDNDSEQDIEPLRIDIQACLTVLGRRNESFKKDWLDLSEVQINKAYLRRANLSLAILRRGQLINANLSEANLRNANLVGANLSGANLNSADLIKADLNGVNLIGAKLIKADLSGAQLITANLYKAALCKANLIKANLIKANLIEVDFLAADLTRADLSGAELSFTKNLTCRQIRSAKIDRETILPDYIKVTWADDGTYTCEMVEDSK